MRLAAQDAPADTTKKPARLRALVVPAFGYAPETRGYIGAVALFTLRLYPGDTLTRPSNFKTEINYTQNKQLILDAGWNFFLRGERWYFPGEAGYFKFPENFYGIGPRTKKEHEELYDSRRIDAVVSLLNQLSPHLFLGPRFMYQRMYDIKPDSGKAMDAALKDNSIPGIQGSTSPGIGLAAMWDKRGNILNPQAGGHYISLANIFFQKAWGSTYDFTRWELDMRKYVPLAQKGILALQGVATLQAGTPPFRMMALLGSGADMRGYYRGRFRDRQYMSAQAEYRYIIYRRWGVAGFAGVGDVAPVIGKFSVQSLKPSYGVGIRFLIDRKENVNMRLDMAWGQGSDGFYVAFGEAF